MTGHKRVAAMWITAIASIGGAARTRNAIGLERATLKSAPGGAIDDALPILSWRGGTERNFEQSPNSDPSLGWKDSQKPQAQGSMSGPGTSATAGGAGRSSAWSLEGGSSIGASGGSTTMAKRLLHLRQHSRCGR